MAIKKDPTTKTSISSKQRNIFVRNYQRLLGREFAIDGTSFVQIMQVRRNDATFVINALFSSERALFSV